ncbi:hypothetical protein EWM64_g3425 [Hericium alpestre]|uniref:Zinc/iron permease n=1 Tax=Hericium alpestre TaxID=135208 RepID=A0A4Z0A2Q0_9AGAM|nr:hypothetical protein EWM64_g3425 [Hericium alpestre]
MAVIFFVSLLAVSFPSISRKVKSIQPPRMIFFIGKHFGTGVILSTAFVHLLQDSFESLLDPAVREKTNIGHWAGLIVMTSLLVIFVVEYASTSYVDRLQSFPSAPPSPKREPVDSPVIDVEQPTTDATSPTPPERGPQPTETTALIPPSLSLSPTPDTSDADNSRLTSSASASSSQKRRHSHSSHLMGIFGGHHRHEPRAVHAEHHEQLPRGSVVLLPESDTVLAGPKDSRQRGRSQDHEHQHDPRGHAHHHAHTDIEALLDDGVCEEVGEAEEVEIGRSRQIVGILVLQLGIMIHSLVIGLTLAVASGSDFTSLVAAISFHQLFEGLSLGIRIAGLPAPHKPTGVHMPFPKALLAFLFAITTPLGIIIGVLSFGPRTHAESASMKLTEGVMSAISGGMLVYAVCVEMLAGDFVLDPTLWRSGVGKQALALASLFAGAAAMTLLSM